MDTSLSYNPLIRNSVRIDGFNNLFQNLLNDEPSTVPMYNVEKHGEDNYAITLAVPGFQNSDITITFQNDQLKVIGKKEIKEEGKEYLYKGIHATSFEHNFRLANHMKVVSAELDHGLLSIQLKYEVPEEAKPRMIAINSPNRTESRAIEDKGRKKAN
jgi:molecular chaperone IbpA